MRLLLLTLSCCLYASPPLPLYEFGVGSGIFHVPLYPGSRETQTRSLVLPFFLYRGKVLQSDQRGGLRGLFIRNPRYRLDFSASGGFSSNATDSKARNGMNDLDWNFQVGPRFVYLITPAEKQRRWQLNIPIRSVFTTNFKSWVDRGFIFNPKLTYYWNHFLHKKVDLFFSLSSAWASLRISEYFYEVDENEVTPSRKAYQAHSGFLESALSTSMRFQLSDQLRIFSGFSFNDYSSARNRASPLLNSRNTSSFAIALVWTFHKSSQPAFIETEK